MKIIIFCLSLLASNLSFALTKKVLCQNKPGQSLGAFSFVINNSHWEPNSGLFSIVKADWGFAYSTASSMSCTDQIFSLKGKENFKCIGYLNGIWRIEIEVEFNQDKGFAKAHNIDDNLYASMTEGLILPCKLLKL